MLALGAFLVVRQEASAGVIIAATMLTSRALAPIELVIAKWRFIVAARQSWHALSAAPTEPACIALPPKLFSTVTRIAADTIKDDKAGAYYLVRIALDSGEAERLHGRRLVAGMPVEAFIRTSERSVLSYMLKPLTDQASRAFREN